MSVAHKSAAVVSTAIVVGGAMIRSDLLSTASAWAMPVCDLALRTAGNLALSACAFAGAGAIWLLASPSDVPAEAVAAFADAVRADPRPAVWTLGCLSAVPVFSFWFPPALDRAVARARCARESTGAVPIGWSPFDRRGTARHEAAHALVATVLGVPFDEARVYKPSFSRPSNGHIHAVAPDRPHDPTEAYGLLARKVAVFAAGVIGAHDGDGPISFVGGGEKDRESATLLSWAACDYAPGRNLFREVVDALTAALAAEPWPSAIAEAADVLLAADGEPLPAEPFHEIARRHGLRLDAVEGLCAKETTDA